MASFTILLARSLLKLMLVSPILLAPLFSLAAPLEVVEKIPKNQVAFVPFANDSTFSPIILSDLNKTELKVTSAELPQLPHSSSDIINSLPLWQSLDISYLIVGSTHINGDKIIVDYEVIDISTGQAIDLLQKYQFIDFH